MSGSDGGSPAFSAGPSPMPNRQRRGSNADDAEASERASAVGSEQHSDVQDYEEGVGDDDPGSLGYQEEEEDEEEYFQADDDDASEHSDKRQRVDSGASSELVQLRAENDSLKREIATLRNNVIPKLLDIKSGQESLMRVFGAYSSSSRGLSLPAEPTAAVADAVKNVKLVQVFGVGRDEITLQEGIDKLEAPVRFKAVGSFPQAIAVDSRTQGRQYQVESRRPTCFRFRLVNKLDGRPASERDLCPDGMLPFRMSMRFADNNEEVTEGAFGRLTETTFTKPALKHLSVQQMSNGELAFNVTRWDCTSNDSSPKSRLFVIWVYPEHPDFKDNLDLKVATPPFLIRSKVTTK